MADVFLPNFLRQKAVYWSNEGTDEDGSTIYGEPIQIKCRWEDLNEEYTDKAGDVRISNAKVMVDRALDLGGALWLGTLDDLTSANDPMANEGAYEIKKFNTVPNINAKKFVRTAIL